MVISPHSTFPVKPSEIPVNRPSPSKWYNPSTNQSKALKGLMCELNMGVYFVNGDGQIMGKEISSGNFGPIPIQTLFVGDLKLNGLETPDENALSFSLPANWSDDIAIVTPTDFNPLTDLANASA